VRDEVFRGQAVGAHRSGSEGAAVAILGYSAAAYAAYLAAPSALTGFALGADGAWSVRPCTYLRRWAFIGHAARGNGLGPMLLVARPTQARSLSSFDFSFA